MNNDPGLFPDLNLPRFQKWALDFVNDCYPFAGISEITLHKCKRKIKSRPAIQGSNQLQNTPFEYMIVIHLCKTDFQIDQRKALKKAAHEPVIWDTTTYLALGVDVKFNSCFNRLSSEPSSEELLQTMRALAFWVFSPNDDETQGDGFGWPPHVDCNALFWRLYPHQSDNAPLTPIFPFHIDILKRQINRWVKEFGLTLQRAFLCSVNLQRDFKKAYKDRAYPNLQYGIVLVSDYFPEQFLRIVKQVDGPLDDDFVTAYTQAVVANWRYEWHIETCSDESTLPSCIESQFRIDLLDSSICGNSSPEQAEKFLLSIKDVLNGILNVTRNNSEEQALENATTYLENNPCSKLRPEYLNS